MELLIQNILQTLRAMRTQVWQVTVSALGLAVSIVCLSFSVNWLWSETNYDAFRPDYKDLYVLIRTDSLGKKLSNSLSVVEQVAEVLRPRGDSVGSVYIGLDIVPLKPNNSSRQPHYYKSCALDAPMLRTLGVEVLHGDINETLKFIVWNSASYNAKTDYNSWRYADLSIVVTDRMAMQLFGRTDVVGEVLYNTEDKIRHPIGAVIKANEGKSHFPYDCIIRQKMFDDAWQSHWCYDIVVRSKDIDATMRALEGMKFKEDGQELFFKPTPLRTYPKLYADAAVRQQNARGDFLRVYFYQLAFVAVSLLLLLSALANLIAVNTSICLSRTREYALRRSLGGSTWQNAQWLLTGIVPTLVLAVILSAVAWEWMLKMQWVEIDEYRAMRIFWLVVLAAVVCCLIGMLYPIIKMHRIYKRSFAGSGAMGHSHGWLVTVQCVVCAFLLFLSWGISRQLHGMMNEDMGLDTRNLLRLHTGLIKPKELEYEYNLIRHFYTLPQEFKRHAGAGIVDAVGVRADIFNRTTYHTVLVGSKSVYEDYVSNNKETSAKEQWLRLHKDEMIAVDCMEMEYDVLRFFKPGTAKGRQMDNRVSEKESFAQVYGDKQFMELVGRIPARHEPLHIITTHDNRSRGYSFSGGRAHWLGQELRIVDEVNLNTTDFHQQRMPTIYVGVPDRHRCAYLEYDAIYIRYADGRLDDAEAAVRKVLKDMDVPDNQYLLTTFEEYMARSYKEDIFYANLVSWLTAFSFLITLAGVFSTLLYTLRLQRRNMAIRRVMGAEFGDVFYGTLRPYVIYAVLGAAVAFAPALLLMRKWMSYFSYGSAPGIGLMLCILLMMLTVITLIVLWQVNKSMNEKPVDVLRPEA